MIRCRCNAWIRGRENSYRRCEHFGRRHNVRVRSVPTGTWVWEIDDDAQPCKKGTAASQAKAERAAMQSFTWHLCRPGRAVPWRF